MFEKRPYQERAILAVIKRLQESKSSGHQIHVPTGGGKTFIAAELIGRMAEIPRLAGCRVWVIAPGWSLLEQFCKTLVAINPSCSNQLGRIGGNAKQLPQVQENPRAPICVSTLDTISNRIMQNNIGADMRPGVVIIDECHLGESGFRQSLLRVFLGEQTPIVGLTATPNSDSPLIPAYSIPYSSLKAAGVVCGYRVLNPLTGAEIDDSLFSGDNENDDGGSGFLELANNSERNQEIVKWLIENKHWIKKTLLFGITKKHCQELNNLLQAAAIKSAVVTSDIDEDSFQSVMTDFRKPYCDGMMQIILTVRKLSHGIDIPDIQTIVLARPTRSRKLSDQMLGRGCRATKGKTHFYVIEFTDNVRRLGVFGVGINGRPISLSPIGEPVSRTASRNRTLSRLRNHEFKLYGAFESYVGSEEVWGEIDFPAELKLPIRKGQTFGFEVELTKKTNGSGLPSPETKAWKDEAARLRSALAGHLGDRVVEKRLNLGKSSIDFRKWNVVYDGSCGWEINTRILEGAAGADELYDALGAINCLVDNNPETSLAPFFRLNVRTGLHLHLGYSFRDVEHVKVLLRLIRLFEPAIATLVAPSRIFQYEGATGTYNTKKSNRYCRPLRQVLSDVQIGRFSDLSEIGRLFGARDSDSRYRSVNFTGIAEGGKTVEIRLHNGTTNFRKLVLWVSLWMQILDASEKLDFAQVPGCTGKRVISPVAGDVGDLVFLCNKYLPHCSLEFLKAIHERRREYSLVEKWKRVQPNYAILSQKWEERFALIVNERSSIAAGQESRVAEITIAAPVESTAEFQL